MFYGIIFLCYETKFQFGGVLMTFDIFVFNQQELENALNTGHTSIGLCDNEFFLPSLKGITYIAIGNVQAFTDLCAEEFEDISCIGFTPIYKEKPSACINVCTPSSSSFISSYLVSSYTLMYEYEYEYENGSFSTSYITSYTTSFLTSYTTSYSTSFADIYSSNYKNHECILVNGYGINLI